MPKPVLIFSKGELFTFVSNILPFLFLHFVGMCVYTELLPLVIISLCRTLLLLNIANVNRTNILH